MYIRDMQLDVDQVCGCARVRVCVRACVCNLVVASIYACVYRVQTIGKTYISKYKSRFCLILHNLQ